MYITCDYHVTVCYYRHDNIISIRMTSLHSYYTVAYEYFNGVLVTVSCLYSKNYLVNNNILFSSILCSVCVLVYNYCYFIYY